MSLEIDDIKFDIDLVKASIYERTLLEKVDKLKYLYESRIVNEALRRYETLWLPLIRNYDGIIAAPIDIYWVWHAHMLCPLGYRKDLKQKFGKIINHTFLSELEYESALASIKEIWTKRFPKESFEINRSNSQNNFTSHFSYDIQSAVMRQASFFYQISLPHYGKKSFLENAIIRYKMFLVLKNKYPTHVLAPCYDIDIIWHTHQLHPLIYAKDTTRILGNILPHDDSINDRSRESRLTQTDKDTRNLWLSNFKQSFSSTGCMFRGESTAGKLNDIEPSYICSLRPKIIELNLNFVTDIAKQFKYILKIFLMNNSERDTCICTYDYYRQNVKYKYDTIVFSTYHNIGFRVKLIKKMGLYTGKVTSISQLFTTQDFDSFKSPGNGIKYSYKMPILQNKKIFDTITMNFTAKSVSESENFYGSVIIGEFLIVSINLENPLLWGQIALPNFDDLPFEGILASHNVQTFCGKYIFDVNVIHSVKLSQSIIQVYSHDKVLCISHLIGRDQLPLVDEAVTSLSYPMLNNKEGQRAMLIKDNKGDWAICIANWRVCKTLGDSQGILEVYLFCLKDNSRCIHLEIDNLNSLYLIVDDLFVNFFTGQIELRSSKNIIELPNYVCLIFTISILYLLCKPKLIKKDPKLNYADSTLSLKHKNIIPDIKVIGRPLSCEPDNTQNLNPKKNKKQSKDAQLLLACGYNYNQYIPSNSFFKQCVNSGGCAGCVGRNLEEYDSESQTLRKRTYGENQCSENVGCFCSDCEMDEESEEWK